jgi:5-hydroxyisourate hydrolase-like protein (transthyretin family)
MKFLDTHIDDIAPGETISKGNVTVTRANKSAIYYSAQEMVTSEQIDGIYFPKDLEIKSINYAVYSEEIDIVITPINQKKFFSISIRSANEYGVGIDDGRKKTTTEKGIDVWEYDKGEKMADRGRYQLMFKINDWYYCIDTSYTEKGYELIDTFTEVTIE